MVLLERSCGGWERFLVWVWQNLVWKIGSMGNTKIVNSAWLVIKIRQRKKRQTWIMRISLSGEIIMSRVLLSVCFPSDIDIFKGHCYYYKVCRMLQVSLKASHSYRGGSLMILLVCTIEYRSKFWLDNFAFTAQYNFVCSISQEYQIWMNGSIFQDKVFDVF